MTQQFKQESKVSSPPTTEIVETPASEKCVCVRPSISTVLPGAGNSLNQDKLYFNQAQNQVYQPKKLYKLFNSWKIELDNGRISYDTFDRLCKTHFENLVELEKYESIEGRNHSVQCSYATDHNCHCWCAGKHHGQNLLVKEVSR